MDSPNDRELDSKIYVVVMRATSSARFWPGEGFEANFNLPDTSRPLRLRMRTRWVDEGHETPAPRELWIEARGPAQSADDAASRFTAFGRSLCFLLSFTANVSAGTPEMHIAYDATDNEHDREFVEVFIPDERGHIREGRVTSPDDLSVLFKSLDSSPEASRISRAIYQYHLALRSWHLGGESLALAHLYMAVEALTKTVIRSELARNNTTEIELARRQGIDVAGKKPWQPLLESWARKTLIFEGDTATHRLAKQASDGLEHGFLELDKVHKSSVSAIVPTFGYVRRTVLRLLGIPRDEHAELYDRHPRDVESLRKMVRGRFVGDGSDPAMETEEYPRLEWHSSIKKFRRDGDKFKVDFNENITVRCSPSYTFQAEKIELKGRLEPGQTPSDIKTVTEIAPSPSESHSSDFERSDELMRQAMAFAKETHKASESIGIPKFREGAFGLYVEAISLFEATQLLVRDTRPIEAMVLLRSLLLAACHLQLIQGNENPEGVALRARLSALDKLAELYSDDHEIQERITSKVRRVEAEASESNITIPNTAPSIAEGSQLYLESRNTIEFTHAVSMADFFAASLHYRTDASGNRSASTQIDDDAYTRGVAIDAVDALVAATVAAADLLGWPYDKSRASELTAEVKRRSANGEKFEGQE